MPELLLHRCLYTFLYFIGNRRQTGYHGRHSEIHNFVFPSTQVFFLDFFFKYVAMVPFWGSQKALINFFLWGAVQGTVIPLFTFCHAVHHTVKILFLCQENDSAQTTGSMKSQNSLNCYKHLVFNSEMQRVRNGEASHGRRSQHLSPFLAHFSEEQPQRFRGIHSCL